MGEKNILSEGINFYIQKKYTDALTFFLALPEDSDVDEIELAYYIGLCYARLENYDDALLYLEQVVTSGKDYDKVMQCRYILAIIYVKTGRKRLADFELNKLLDTGYKTADVLSSLAYLYWQNNEVEKCLAFYARSLEKDSENVTALNGMGYVLAESDRDLPRALSCCKKALDYSPNNPLCLDSLGWIYFKLGLYDEARKYLMQADEILPENETIRQHITKLAEAQLQI